LHKISLNEKTRNSIFITQYFNRATGSAFNPRGVAALPSPSRLAARFIMAGKISVSPKKNKPDQAQDKSDNNECDPDVV
jgi:hypothetical protein